MSADLDGLIAAASSRDDDAIRKLAEAVKPLEVQQIRESSAAFDLLFDGWNDEETYSPAQGNFVIALAERDALESQAFRNALYETVSLFLPPYISSAAVLKAIGARDTAVQTHEVARRLAKLQKIRNGALVNIGASKNWGKLTTIERVTAAFGINSLETGNLNSLPVASALDSAVFFDAHQEIYNLLKPSRATLPTSAVFKKIMMAHALTELFEPRLKAIVAALLVPECLSQEDFEAWWSAAPTAQAQSGKREPWDSRSVLELYTLLAPYAGQGIELTSEQAAKLTVLLNKIRTPMLPKDVSNLALAVSILSEKNPPDMLKEMFSSLRGKAPFWPAVVGTGIQKSLEEWGHLSAKQVVPFVKATCALYTEEEIAQLMLQVPFKCIGPMFSSIDMGTAAAAIFNSDSLTSDLLLFLWRTRTKLPKNLVSIVDMDHVGHAISMEKLPKEWAAAQRDLKRTLFEKADFQKFIIENADGDIPSIIDALQKVTSFQMGECQSIMVKLAGHSDELRERIEGGEGKRLMGKSENVSVAEDNTPITSHASLTKLNKELEDIINVQIPENVKAIAHARSFGDFRENAEYDAAKERRRFLHRRRSELENAVSTVRSTDFKDVVVKDTVVLGSHVTLSGSGKDVEYDILGAWDGDPDRNRISYRTRLGEALIGAKVGGKVKLPDGEFTVKAVAPISEELRKELAD